MDNALISGQKGANFGQVEKCTKSCSKEVACKMGKRRQKLSQPCTKPPMLFQESGFWASMHLPKAVTQKSQKLALLTTTTTSFLWTQMCLAAVHKPEKRIAKTYLLSKNTLHIDMHICTYDISVTWTDWPGAFVCWLVRPMYYVCEEHHLCHSYAGFPLYSEYRIQALFNDFQRPRLQLRTTIKLTQNCALL